MAWRFRKSVSRGPFRWTASKSGLGMSWGIPGLRIGKSASGKFYVSLSIPGTGLSYMYYFGSKK